VVTIGMVGGFRTQILESLTPFFGAAYRVNGGQKPSLLYSGDRDWVARASGRNPRTEVRRS
jgi:hypothetical protein